MVVACFMDPIVTQPAKCQLVHFPSIGALGDFSDDCFGIAKHENDIWKDERQGFKLDLVIILIYIWWAPITAEHATQLVKIIFPTILHEL